MAGVSPNRPQFPDTPQGNMARDFSAVPIGRLVAPMILKSDMSGPGNGGSSAPMAQVLSRRRVDRGMMSGASADGGKTTLGA